MNGKLFLLENTYLQKVKIKDENGQKEIKYFSFEEFKENIPFLINLSKKNKVWLSLTPQNAPVCFSGALSYWTSFGDILLNFSDIGFYKIDKNGKMIFEDLFEKFLCENNSFNELKRALTDKSFKKSLQNNQIYISSGENLLRFLVSDAFCDNFLDEQPAYPSEVLLSILSDEQLVEIIAKKYDLIDKINSDFADKIDYTYSSKTHFISDAIKSVLYAILLVDGNFEILRQIVRSFINELDVYTKDGKYIADFYEILGEYINKNPQLINCGCISFCEIEKAIESSFDYKMLLFVNLLEDNGYRFTKIDFNNQVAYLKKI